MKSYLPLDVAEEIRSYFHASRRDNLKIDLVNNRPGFWNFDRSHFIPCAESVQAMRIEMHSPSPHYPEDALGLGLFNS